jgi:hypothetical protein
MEKRSVFLLMFSMDHSDFIHRQPYFRLGYYRVIATSLALGLSLRLGHVSEKMVKHMLGLFQLL